MGLTREEEYEAESAFRVAWGYTSWSSIEETEKDLQRKKRLALRASGWKRDESNPIPGKDLWMKEIDGIMTRLPFDFAVRVEMESARSSTRDDAYHQIYKKSLRKKARDAGPDATNPYPPGSLGWECWEEGREEG